jgi:regulator of Ty1 transposition protein 103
MAHLYRVFLSLIFPKAIDKHRAGGSSKGLGGGLKLGSGFLGGNNGKSAADIPLEFVPLLKTHRDINEKTSSVTITTGSANTEFQKQFDTEHLPAPPVYAARLSSLLKTLDSADNAVKGAIESRKAHIRNIERLLEQSKAALAKDEGTVAALAEKKKRTEETKLSVENLILEGMEENNSGGDGDRTPGDNTPDDFKSPEIEALTPPAQIQYEPPDPPSASEIHHIHSIAPAAPPQPSEFHAGASELLASLSAPLHNGAGHKRATVDENMFEGIDEDLVDMFKNEGVQHQKRQKAGIQNDDEYVP